MKFELTEPAERDIAGILQQTLEMFGPVQVVAYARILEKGIALVAEDPARPGSLDRSSIGAGVRLFHFELAAGKRGAAAHCLHYATGRLSNGSAGTIVLRVLHERMEPRYRAANSLKTFPAD